MFESREQKQINKVVESLNEVIVALRAEREQLMLVKREVEYLQSLCERLNNAPFMKDVEVR